MSIFEGNGKTTIIEAKDQHMDLIERDGAIDAVNQVFKYLWEHYQETASLAAVVDAICDVPSSMQWIPCFETKPETLPKKDGQYFVTIYHLDAEGPEVEVRTFRDGHFDAELYEAFWVTAYMPLPEPWKGE